MIEEDLGRYPVLAELYMTDPMARAVLDLHFRGHYQMEEVLALLLTYYVAQFEILQEKYGALVRKLTLAGMPANTPTVVQTPEQGKAATPLAESRHVLPPPWVMRDRTMEQE